MLEWWGGRDAGGARGATLRMGQEVWCGDGGERGSVEDDMIGGVVRDTMRQM